MLSSVIAVTNNKYYLYLLTIVILFVIQHDIRQSVTAIFEDGHSPTEPKLFAVFGCSTPTAYSHRGYDYAFYLPLTALAWQRIGFQSIVLIAGTESEWQEDPVLRNVMYYLLQRKARVIFMDAPSANRAMLSQVSRIFVSNLKEAGLKPADYVITTDADLWPLRKAHFVPRPGYDLILTHTGCCGVFQHQNESFEMLAMSNIGATSQIWRNIINQENAAVSDADSILGYLGHEFGVAVLNTIQYSSNEWFTDQKLVSVLVSRWRNTGVSKSCYMVPDRGFSRIDRFFWDADKLTISRFTKKFDAHMPYAGYSFENWKKIEPLVHLMYGENSSYTSWCNQYLTDFRHSLEAKNTLVE